MKDTDLYAHRSDLNDAAMDKAERRIRNRIDNALQKIDRDIGMRHMDPGDVLRLRYASQQIKEGAPRIYSLIDHLKEHEHPLFRSMMRGLDDLTEGLVEAATRLAATPSGKNFFGGVIDQEKGQELRYAKNKKNADRNNTIDTAIVMSVQAQKVSGKWPSEWKLADAIRVDVRRRLRGSGYKIGPTAIYDRVLQLFENNTLSRSALVEASCEPRQAGRPR